MNISNNNINNANDPNRRNSNNGMNGIGNSSGNRSRTNCSDSVMDKRELLHKIQALAFAKTETELYLDAHPDASVALEYYKDLVEKLRTVTEEYEAKYGPLTASGVNGDSWSWVEGRWPWQYDMEEDG